MEARHFCHYTEGLDTVRLTWLKVIMRNRLATWVVVGCIAVGGVQLASCSGRTTSVVVPLSNPTRAAELNYNAAWSHVGGKTSASAFTVRYDRAGKATATVGSQSAGVYQVGPGGGLATVADLGVAGSVEHVLLLASQMPNDGHVMKGNTWQSVLPGDGNDKRPSFEFQFQQEIVSADRSGVKVHQIASRRLVANTWSKNYAGGVANLSSGWKVFAEGDWKLDSSGSVESGRVGMIAPTDDDVLSSAAAAMTATFAVSRAP